MSYTRTASILRATRGSPIRAVLTTAGRKRDGHDLDPAGCDLTRYRATGSPLLVGHDAATVPVGTVTDIRIEPHRVTGELRYSRHGRGPELEEMTREGTVNAVSIRWDPIDIDRSTGITRRWSLLETSLVGVPLDDGCVVYQRSGGCPYGLRTCASGHRPCVRCRRTAAHHPATPVPAHAARALLDAVDLAPVPTRAEQLVQRIVADVLAERVAEAEARQRRLDADPPTVRLMPL